MFWIDRPTQSSRLNVTDVSWQVLFAIDCKMRATQLAIKLLTPNEDAEQNNMFSYPKGGVQTHLGDL